MDFVRLLVEVLPTSSRSSLACVPVYGTRRNAETLGALLKEVDKLNDQFLGNSLPPDVAPHWSSYPVPDSLVGERAIRQQSLQQPMHALDLVTFSRYTIHLDNRMI